MALPVVGGADATFQTGKDARRRRVPRPQEGGRQPQDRRGEGEAREDRAALQPGPHRPREDSLPSQFYLSVDVSLPGLAILSSRQTDERRIEMGKLIATTETTPTTRSSVRRDPAGWCWVARPTRVLRDTGRASRASGRTWSTRCRSTLCPTPCPEISSGTRPCSRGTSRNRSRS